MEKHEPYVNKHPKRQAGLKKALPFLIFGSIAIFIAIKEVPSFRHPIEYFTAHERWQASESCQVKAIELASSVDFARLIDKGDAHETAKGYFIENITVGEPAESGGENRFTVDCYTDSLGLIIRADRR